MTHRRPSSFLRQGFLLAALAAAASASAADPVPPYVVKELPLANGIKVKVGILGLTNPGIAIWDKANVEGRMEFPGLVEQAKEFVPRLKAMGCDVVIVSAHSGADTSSSYGDGSSVNAVR